MSSKPSSRSTGGFNRHNLFVIQAKMRTNPMPEAMIHPVDENVSSVTLPPAEKKGDSSVEYCTSWASIDPAKELVIVIFDWLRGLRLYR